MNELTTIVPETTQRALPVTMTRPTPSFQPVLEQVARFANQPAVLKSIPWLVTLGLVAAAALIWSVIGTGSGRSLYQGLDDADRAAVVQALDSSSIKYEIDRDTGAITVADEDFYKAKMMLAQQGLPKSAPNGESMLDSMPLGVSRAVEGEKLRGARETDLARTIEEIDAVAQARVHLAVQQPSVFLRDTAKPSASVMLRLYAGRQLSEAQVQAIVHLVGSSVPGLSPDDVSVVDQSGRLLSNSGSDPAARATNAQVQLQSKIEARYIEALNKLLTPMLGTDNYTAEVHADLNFAEVQSTRESYPKDTAVVRNEEGGWTSDGANGAGAGGVPGALSNQAPPAAQVAAAPGGALTPAVPGATSQAAASVTKTSENYNRAYQLDHEISVTRNPLGDVRRLSVAVAIREDAKAKLKPAELAKIENLIKGAVGFDQQRGDLVAVSVQKFAPLPEAEDAPFYEAPMVLTIGRNLGVLALAALLIFGIGRPLLARKPGMAPSRQASGEGATQNRALLGNEIAAEISGQARLAHPEAPVTLDMIQATPGYAERAELIRNFVRQDPSRAALVVRDLIRSDMPGGAEQNG